MSAETVGYYEEVDHSGETGEQPASATLGAREAGKLRTFADRYGPDEVEYGRRRTRGFSMLAALAVASLAGVVEPPRRARRASTGSPAPLDRAGAAAPKTSKRQARRAKARRHDRAAP